jgi:hypothetical protein
VSLPGHLDRSRGEVYDKGAGMGVVQDPAVVEEHQRHLRAARQAEQEEVHPRCHLGDRAGPLGSSVD